eukprot:TRINITY_DN2773_c0_g1_i2.p1 TRINITY_DN2773_c0_g1~~TRINITY_DN2773_c0_g1_i2.p1  ORF type:complete len:480 (+),score=117.74 TRINITY_DN2773_c0_g1_i2:94-1440(+)
MADDLGWGEPGIYNSTSPHGCLSTPNIDQFGREGTIFTNSYAGYTVCAPSRTTLFTGRHSGQFVKMGLNGQDLTVAENYTTISQMLQQAGYTTGAFGKTAPLESPFEQGFDKFLGQLSQLYCHNMYPTVIDYAPPVNPRNHSSDSIYLANNAVNKTRELCMAHPELFNYSIDMFQAAALEWLEHTAAQADEQPFFMYVSYTIPHAGGWGDRPDAPEQGQPVPTDFDYTNTSWPDVERDHAAVVHYLDQQVGQIMDALKQAGVDDNTLVVFASDNGAHQEGGHKVAFFNSTGGLRGFKRSLYEGGVRSPTMVRWPGKVPAGRISDYMWAFWDAFPTFAELAGAPAPAVTDGISIVPTLLGQTQAPKDYLYHTWGSGKNTGYGVNAGKWKGVVHACGQGQQPSKDDVMELYDLTQDPFETNDVSKANPDAVAMLKGLILDKDLTCTCYQC